jgi:hypothetical protein
LGARRTVEAARTNNSVSGVVANATVVGPAFIVLLAIFSRCLISFHVV